LTNLQKRYLDVQDLETKISKREKEVKELLRKEYKDGKMMELGIDIMRVDVDLRTDIIEEIYKQGDLKFIEKYLSEIKVKLKNEIFENEYKNGNEELVYNNFDKLSNGDLKDKIIKVEWDKRKLRLFM